MKRFFLTFLILLLVAIGAYAVQWYTRVKQARIAPSFDYTNIPANLTSQSYTRQEVAQHNKSTDCWMIIAEKVFDVTPEIDIHPGGSIITLGCGKDATALFYMRPSKGDIHGTRAINELHNFYIGELRK